MLRFPSVATFQALCIAASIAMFAGCSGNSTSVMSPGFNSQARHIYERHYSCPATGPIEYLSDNTNNVINVYAGDFAGQQPCGQITSGLDAPVGLRVNGATHDLYVANWHGGNILVFHRGQATAYNSYVDPSGQFPSDVDLAKDGTIVSSNSYCSISTWIAGPNGGTYVGNYAKPSCRLALDLSFITITGDDTAYYVNSDSGRDRARLWSVACPAGVCSGPVRVKHVVFGFYGGSLRTDSSGDVFAVRESAAGRDNEALTFEPPNPKAKSFDLVNGGPMGMAIDEKNHHWFVADNFNFDAEEYAYPSGKPLGIVSGDTNAANNGIAFDP